MFLPLEGGIPLGVSPRPVLVRGICQKVMVATVGPYTGLRRETAQGRFNLPKYLKFLFIYLRAQEVQRPSLFRIRIDPICRRRLLCDHPTDKTGENWFRQLVGSKRGS